MLAYGVLFVFKKKTVSIVHVEMKCHCPSAQQRAKKTKQVQVKHDWSSNN